MKTSQLASLCFTCLLIIMPVAASAQPYAIADEGREVIDKKTGLVWRRCAEGMSWDATSSSCTETALQLSYDAALQRAKDVASLTTKPWRVPNVKELASIADISLSYPAIDGTAFPATPPGAFWSSSPYVGGPADAWGVDFRNGGVDSYNRTLANHVRLVRTGQ